MIVFHLWRLSPHETENKGTNKVKLNYFNKGESDKAE